MEQRQSVKHGKQKSYYNCSVDGCLNSTINSPLSFFKLPPATAWEKRAQWLKLINREDITKSALSRARICEAHFSPNAIRINATRKMLKKHAIPQLNLPFPRRVNDEIQAIVSILETADASVQCDIDFETNDPVTSLLTLQYSNDDDDDDTPQKRKHSESPESRKRVKISNSPQSEFNDFNKLCDKFLTPNLARVVKQQTKNKTPGSGNKFNLDYKIFCLNLYDVSPQAYDLLKDTLCLPGEDTLTKMHMPVTTKIGSYIMDVLEIKSQYMSDMDRNCTLVVDTMSLKENIVYHAKEDRIYGLHEVDGVQSPEIAKYVIVAVLQGLIENYIQPVGFAFLAECENYSSVRDWIDKLIASLFSIGFHVRCLVSNMGPGFLNGARDRLVSAESPYFFVDDRKVYYIFDPPDLMKLLRNNLINYEFHFDNNVAKWHHILQFYEMDKLKRLRLVPKLTESHVNPTNSEQMKVEYAVQIFSATVAAAISTYRDFGIIEYYSEGTIRMIQMMNDLFDFLNTSSRYGNTQYRNAFSGEEYQINFINTMLNFFASLKLINPNDHQNVTSEGKFIEGFQITLKSLLMLFEDMRTEGFSYVLTRRLNQECMENVFAQIRKENDNSTEPTAWQLISAFRKIFLMNIIKSPKSGEYMEDLAKCFAVYEGDPETPSIMVSTKKGNESSSKIISITTTDYNTLDVPENNALVYVSGYLLGKCVDHHKECNEFMAYIKGEDNEPNFSQGTTFTRYMDFCRDGSKTLSTILPDNFVEFVGLMEERFYNFFERDYLGCEILKSLLNEVQNVPFSKPCKCFPLDYCKNLYIRMRTYITVKNNNRTIRQCRDGQKTLSVIKLT